jgi:hypothetical protein
MSVERYRVRLVSQSGTVSEGVFVVDEDSVADDCRLAFHYAGGDVVAQSPDYFEAMCEIRSRLDAAGWRPDCFGSSRNVYPSNMCRDMGRGLKAYKLHLGRPAEIRDLVSIFESGPDVDPASVEDQRQFFECWLASLNTGTK